MKKKILIYFFIFTLIFPKVVVGSTAEKIMVGIGEKAGVKAVTKSARERALQKWNYDFHNLDKINDAEIKARVEKFRKQLDEAKIEPLAGKPGWSKAIINTTLFLTGADLIYDGITAFENAKSKAEVEAVLADDYESGNMYTSGYGVIFKIGYEGVFNDYVTESETWTLNYKSNNEIIVVGKSVKKGTGFNYYRIDEKADDRWKITGVFHGLDWKGRPNVTEVTGTIFPKYMTGDPTAEPIIEVFTPTPLEIPDYNIPQVLQPLKDSNASPISTPELPTLPYEDIEILIPDGPLADPSPENVPGNEPLDDTGKDPGREPGTETPTEPGTDPGTETPTEPGTDPGTETPTDPGTGEPPTDPPPGDGGNPVKKINWPKLKAIPMAFTTAFPFSLPWDIAKGLDATFGSIDDQKGPIKFTWNAYKESTPITFTVPEMFLDWFKYIRTFILIIFDIGFIYAVRKLLGGAS